MKHPPQLQQTSIVSVIAHSPGVFAPHAAHCDAHHGCATAMLVSSLLLISGPLPLPALAAAPLLLPFSIKLTVIYLVVAAVSSLSQFFNPSTKALLKEIVPEEQLTRASALSIGRRWLAESSQRLEP